MKRHLFLSRAQTRMSGVNLDGREIRKGAVDAITKYLNQFDTSFPREIQSAVERLRVLAVRL